MSESVLMNDSAVSYAVHFQSEASLYFCCHTTVLNVTCLKAEQGATG